MADVWHDVLIRQMIKKKDKLDCIFRSQDCCLRKKNITYIYIYNVYVHVYVCMYVYI